MVNLDCCDHAIHTCKQKKLSWNSSDELSDFSDASTVTGSSFHSSGGETAVEVDHMCNDDDFDPAGRELRLDKLVDAQSATLNCTAKANGTSSVAW